MVAMWNINKGAKIFWNEPMRISLGWRKLLNKSGDKYMIFWLSWLMHENGDDMWQSQNLCQIKRERGEEREREFCLF